jgi:nicotinic acid mononucleotide adenylyltransferase
MADKEKKKDKKIVGYKEFDSTKYIDIEPTIDEAKKNGGTVVIAWGRMNPMSAGHEMLVKKVVDVAKTEKGTPQIYLSHTQGAKTKTGKGAVNKDPLAYDDKIKFAQKAFGPIVKKSPAKTIIELLKLLDKQFDRVVLVAGSDRVKEFNNTLNKYNGKEYKFSELKIVSAGQRDEEADDVSGISGTKMRGYAKTDMKKFTANLPKKLKGDAEEIAALVNKGTQMTEENDVEMDEALNRVQRFKKARAMRKARAKIKRGQERAKRKKADMTKIKLRAKKSARNMIKDRLAKPKKYASLSYAEKERIDKRMEKIPPARIDRLARKMIPMVKKKEQERLKSARSKSEEVDLDEQFTMFMEKMTKPQDSDVADRPGSQPKGYYKGVDKDKKDARAAHFEKGAKMSDDNPAAYKPAPGDKEAKTKESKFTKKARAMGFTEDLVWEELVEGLDEGLWGQRISKRPHMLYAANGKVKFDKRFKMYRPKDVKESNEFDIEDIAELYEATEGYMSEDKAGKSLKDKAAKSGMPAGILRKVYNRGVAAWRTGHRPGTTPEQWGHARVNSFITKSSGTWGKADKDLADKVRKEGIEEMNEAPRRKGAPKMTGDSVAIQRAKDAEHAKAMGRSVKTGRKLPKKTMTSTQRSLASLRGEEVQLDELTAAEKKLVNQMYDKKGNLTPLGKKVMNHGKKPGDKGYVESNLDEQATEFLEKYSAPTPEEIKKDKERERKASGKQRPSMNAKSATKKTYGGMMGGLKAGYGYGEEKSSKKHVNTKPTIDEDEKENLAKYAAAAMARKKEAGEMDDNPKPKYKDKFKRKEVDEASCGAGEQGTNELTKKYKKDTPMESIPPEVVGAALAAPMVAQGAKAAAKGAYRMAKKIVAKKKVKK